MRRSKMQREENEQIFEFVIRFYTHLEMDFAYSRVRLNRRPHEMFRSTFFSEKRWQKFERNCKIKLSTKNSKKTAHKYVF